MFAVMPLHPFEVLVKRSKTAAAHQPGSVSQCCLQAQLIKHNVLTDGVSLTVASAGGTIVPRLHSPVLHLGVAKWHQDRLMNCPFHVKPT